MFTVAIIGPDGVGKTTIARRLEASSVPGRGGNCDGAAKSLRAKYLYMGVSADSSNVMLPTTWLIRLVKRGLGRPADRAGPRHPGREKPQPKNVWRKSFRFLKSMLRLGNQIGEETFRQCLVRFYLLRGCVVVTDRDFFADYHAYDIDDRNGPRPLARRIHGAFLTRVYRRPDLIIFLDAPAQTMYARKGEGTLEILDKRRRDYQELDGKVRCFETVNADRSLEEVAADVESHIRRYHQSLQANHS